MNQVGQFWPATRIFDTPELGRAPGRETQGETQEN